MLDHWEKHGPPVYIAVAGYLGLGVKGKSGSKAKTEKPGDLNELLKLAGAGGMIQ